MIFVALLSLSALARTISAHQVRNAPKSGNQNPGLCSLWLPNMKSTNQQGELITICPYPEYIGGLHYICGNYASTDAAAICEEAGWRLAMLEEGVNTANATVLLENCQGAAEQQYAAWIAGYNGLSADPCMITYNYDGVAVGVDANLGIQFCQTERAGILCQDVPVVTVTVTLGSQTVTVPSGRSTVSTRTTTTVSCSPTHHHGWCPCSSESSSSSSESCDCHCNCSWNCNKKDKNCIPCPPQAKGVVEKSTGGPAPHRRPSCDSSSSSSSSSCSSSSSSHDDPNCFPPSCDNCPRNPGNTCTKVCNATFGNIRVLQKDMAIDDADEECKKFGWTLLDMLSVNEAEMISLFGACFESDFYPSGWVRSFDGVSASCPVAYLDSIFNRVSVEFPVSENVCNEAYYAFCHTGCPHPVGNGPDHGNVSIVQSFTTPITTVFTPTTTVTVTSTITTRINGKKSNN